MGHTLKTSEVQFQVTRELLGPIYKDCLIYLQIGSGSQQVEPKILGHSVGH